jgi:hypothetical protein
MQVTKGQETGNMIGLRDSGSRTTARGDDGRTRTVDEQANVTDKTVSLLAANVFGTLFGLLPAVGLHLLFTAVWRGRVVQTPPEWFTWLHFLGLLVAGIVVHELLHGLGWMVFGGVARADIEIGVKWKLLTPYAHTRARMATRAYRWAVLLPGLVLGMVPALLAIASGSVLLLTFGLAFTVAAGGDFLVLWLLRDVPAEAKVADHPTKAGSVVYE